MPREILALIYFWKLEQDNFFSSEVYRKLFHLFSKNIARKIQAVYNNILGLYSRRWKTLKRFFSNTSANNWARVLKQFFFGSPAVSYSNVE